MFLKKGTQGFFISSRLISTNNVCISLYHLIGCIHSVVVCRYCTLVLSLFYLTYYCLVLCF